VFYHVPGDNIIIAIFSHFMILRSKLYTSFPHRPNINGLTAWLCLLTALLVAANLVSIFSETIFHQNYSLARQFYFDQRLNIPFYFGLALLALNIYFIYRIIIETRNSESQSIFWKILGVIFLLFTVDASFDLHYTIKMSTFGTIASYDERSPSHYLWVIPYIVVFGFLMLKLKKHSTQIHPHLVKNITRAAALFLFGAVCMEFAGIYYFVVTRKVDIWLLLIKSTETLFQMIGSIAFINIFSQHYTKLTRSK
jgi:hypothetical protein